MQQNESKTIKISVNNTITPCNDPESELSNINTNNNKNKSKVNPIPINNNLIPKINKIIPENKLIVKNGFIYMNPTQSSKVQFTKKELENIDININVPEVNCMNKILQEKINKIVHNHKTKNKMQEKLKL